MNLTRYTAVREHLREPINNLLLHDRRATFRISNAKRGTDITVMQAPL